MNALRVPGTKPMSVMLSGRRRSLLSGRAFVSKNAMNSLYSGTDATTLLPPMSMTLTSEPASGLTFGGFGLHLRVPALQVPWTPQSVACVPTVQSLPPGIAPSGPFGDAQTERTYAKLPFPLIDEIWFGKQPAAAP